MVPVPDDLECFAGYVPFEFLRGAAGFQYLVNNGGLGRAACFGSEDHCFGIIPERARELNQARRGIAAVIGPQPGEPEPFDHTAVVIEAIAMPGPHPVLGVNKVERKIVGDK